MTVIFVGDVGTEIRLDCGVDISTSTVQEIHVRKPNGQSVVWAADPFGTNFISYTTVTGDINIAGKWLLQAYVEMPDWRGCGLTAVLDVQKPI